MIIQNRGKTDQIVPHNPQIVTQPAQTTPKNSESTAYPTRSRRILEQKTNHQGSLTHSEVSAAPQASKT